MRVPKRLVELKQRVEPTVKTFEWTWTTAVVFCVGLWFFILIFAVVVPSFWMYFAEQKLGWAGPSGGGSWALALAYAPESGLWVGGQFPVAGSAPSDNVALWTAAGA